MVVEEIRIYIEGGGDNSYTKTPFRRGWSTFFKNIISLARKNQIKWSIIVCGGRSSTYKDFTLALKSHPNAFNILLVDSEGAVKPEYSSWAYLHKREQRSNKNTTDDQCHLMAQIMETWFVADTDSLQNYYGDEFKLNDIPKTPDVESIDKNTVLHSLENATQKTSKGKYHKVRHASELLELVDITLVRQKAPRCDQLFKTLERLLENSIT